MRKQWYVLHVKPHKERIVQNRLQNEGVTVYCPVLQTASRSKRATGIKPFFPGYVFIHTNLESIGTNSVRWMPGAIGIVLVGGSPAAISQNAITEIQQRVAIINAAGGLKLVDLKAGDRVRIIDGPLAGYEAIFDASLPGNDRVQVLLAFLSRHPQPVKLDKSAIANMKQDPR